MGNVFFTRRGAWRGRASSLTSSRLRRAGDGVKGEGLTPPASCSLTWKWRLGRTPPGGHPAREAPCWGNRERRGQPGRISSWPRWGASGGPGCGGESGRAAHREASSDPEQQPGPGARGGSRGRGNLCVGPAAPGNALGRDCRDSHRTAPGQKTSGGRPNGLPEGTGLRGGTCFQPSGLPSSPGNLSVLPRGLPAGE